MDHERGHKHGCGYPEGSDPADEPANQSDCASELSRYCEKRKQCRYMHLSREEIHRGTESEATKPSERLLGPVRKHRQPKGQARNQWGITFVRFEERSQCFHKS